MELNTLFEQAVTDSKSLPEKPGNNVLLKLYAFYKQSTVGDINVGAPQSAFDFVARAKYDAWQEQKGKSKEAAMQEYIDLIRSLKG